MKDKIIEKIYADEILGMYDTMLRYELGIAVQKIPEQKPELPEPVCFTGIGTGKRSDAVQVSVYDAMMEEIHAEKDAEKARVRNRRKADRKAKRKSGSYVKRNGGEFRKDEHYAGDGRMWHDTYNWDLSKSQIGGKIRERSLRKDWDAEIEEIIEDLDWAFFDMEYLNEQIGMLERNLHVGDNYVRFNRLCERRNVVAEVIRKNRFVEEMVKGEC